MSTTQNTEGQAVSTRVAELEKELAVLKSLQGQEKLLVEVDSLHAHLCNEPHMNGYPTTNRYCGYLNEGDDIDAWTKPAHQKWLTAVEDVKFPIEGLESLTQVIKSLSEVSKVA